MVEPQYSPGTLLVRSFRDALRYQAERGDFGPGDRDDLIERVVANYQRGEAGNFERTIAGSGRTLQIYVAPTPEDGTVTIGGSGDVLVNVTHDLDVDIGGSGNVEDLGNPTVTQDIGGSGRVSRR